MKNSFFLFLTLLSLSLNLLYAQKEKEILRIENLIPEAKNKVYKEEIIKHTYYMLSYNEEHEQPSWVVYLLTKEMVGNVNAKRKDRFREDKMVSTYSAHPSDYTKSGYDRGHICPSADMLFSQQAQDETFFMSNMSPQKHSFNGGKWKTLEEKQRLWAIQNDSILIIAGPIFDSIIGKIGKNQVSVPYRFFKIIIDISYPTYKAIGFIMENRKLEEDIFYYSMPISEIEKETLLNFFPKFDNNKFINLLEKTLERKKWE
ncbi:MAG: DNA/RNA non-specific endonuclease [Bacteroidales bacterium]|jgi:endonuclease G|nr:DNA/RNA non-specific endonuclease [Bacteroidales bacterium]